MSVEASRHARPATPTPGTPGATRRAGWLPRFALGSAEHTAPVPGDGMWEPEPARVRWGRRALTIPGLLVATAIYGAALPVILLVAAAIDLGKRSPMLRCRAHLAVASCFVWHVIGVSALGLWWLAGKSLRVSLERWRTWHRRLEGWWSHKMIGILTVLYGLEYDIEDAHVVNPGPTIILARHASIADTLLPARVLSRGPDGLLLRIVKKRELLWDPGVDLISHRVPRAFVRRGSGDTERELEALRRIVGGMDHDDAIVIFPEGTRFTPAKRAAIVARLEASDPPWARRAARLKHLLPPRAAGAFALLQAQPDLDVVFLAHTGFEGASELKDLLAGTVLGRTLRAKFFRVPRREVPRDREAFQTWLADWWEFLDRWIAQQKARS